MLGTKTLSIVTHVRGQKLVNVKTYLLMQLVFQKNFETPGRTSTGL